MLPKKYRLHQKVDILRTLRRGRHITHPAAAIYIYKDSSQRTLRVACVVGKKVSSKAVARHKYQRWLRQVASAILAKNPPAVDMVIVARPAITKYQQLRELKQDLTQYLSGILL